MRGASEASEEREQAEASRRHFEDLRGEQQEANRASAIYVERLPDGVPEAHRKHLADCEKEKGNEAFYSKDLEEAEAYYTRSLHFRADDPSTWANRALVRLKLQRPEGALQDCEHSLALNRTYMKALHRKGKALYELQRYEEAVSCFQAALAESPGNSQINGDLMVARRRLRSDGPAPRPPRPRHVDDAPSCTVEELPDGDGADVADELPAPATGYTRVQIEEDSDSDEADGVHIEELEAGGSGIPGRGFRQVPIEEVSGDDDEDFCPAQPPTPASPSRSRPIVEVGAEASQAVVCFDDMD